MTKPNAIEEIMARAYDDGAPSWPIEAVWGAYGPQVRRILAALDATGLAVVPRDWNHREEDWSPKAVSEWLSRQP